LGVAKGMRRRSICHVHEAESSLPLVLRRALTLPLLLADQLIANSNFSLTVLTGAFARLGRKSTVVYNAVPGPSSVSAGRDELVGPCRLLYVGRLSPRKGPQVAVAALKQLRQRGVDAHLDLAGAVFPGYEWFQQELQDAITADQLTDRVTFHGFQSDVWPHFANADIVVVPSTVDEPFGNTAVEAVLASRPLVVSATSGLIEAASGYASAQSVRPGQSEALADAVEAVVDSWSEFRDRAVADSAIAHERHEPERYRRQIVEIVTASP
jgi:glycosyltransferase involved in cell wall biosynthesis